YDMIRQVRNTLPESPIVYTLHEYLPICHRQGQMVRRVNDEELCDQESPQRCHQCFPDISPQAFYLRKRFIQSHLSVVDLFLAPSRFLRDRYIAWGIPEEKIRFEEYGRQPLAPISLTPRSPPAAGGERGVRGERVEESVRNRFGYFGQLTPFKGDHLEVGAM